MPMNYITLTRQELNDIAWAKPMNNLAKEFRIAEVGPAKRCRAVDVPHPHTAAIWPSKPRARTHPARHCPNTAPAQFQPKSLRFLQSRAWLSARKSSTTAPNRRWTLDSRPSTRMCLWGPPLPVPLRRFLFGIAWRLQASRRPHPFRDHCRSSAHRALSQTSGPRGPTLLIRTLGEQLADAHLKLATASTYRVRWQTLRSVLKRKRWRRPDRDCLNRNALSLRAFTLFAAAAKIAHERGRTDNV
jgi:hypothetical protein